MVNKNAKILILYAKFGDGHYQVAQALKQQFAEQGFKQIQLFDPFASQHPLLNRIAQFAYLKSTSYLPVFYGWGYALTNRIKSSSAIGQWLHALGVEELQQQLVSEMPAAVIQTFPLLTMSSLRQQTGIPIPTFTVLTDYVLHRRWLHVETDKYFVATEHLKLELTEAGVKGDKICVSGIPLRQMFQEQAMKREERQTTLSDGRKRVLIMAGAYGVSTEVGDMVQMLLHEHQYEIELVCGRNEKLQQQMERLFGQASHVHIHGYVAEMAALMSNASCLITKAGGITLTEALHLNLPVVVYRPIPGQESGNAEYWARQGRLSIASSLKQLKQSTLAWLEGEQGVLAYEQTTVQAPDATSIIVSNVIAHFGETAGHSRTTATVLRPVIKRGWRTLLKRNKGLV